MPTYRNDGRDTVIVKNLNDILLPVLPGEIIPTRHIVTSPNFTQIAETPGLGSDGVVIVELTGFDAGHESITVPVVIPEQYEGYVSNDFFYITSASIDVRIYNDWVFELFYKDPAIFSEEANTIGRLVEFHMFHTVLTTPLSPGDSEISCNSSAVLGAVKRYADDVIILSPIPEVVTINEIVDATHMKLWGDTVKNSHNSGIGLSNYWGLDLNHDYNLPASFFCKLTNPGTPLASPITVTFKLFVR